MHHNLAQCLTHITHLVLVNMISDIVTTSFHLLRLCHSLGHNVKGPRDKGSVSGVALFEGHGTFRRWDLVGHHSVMGSVPLKGVI